MLKPSGVDKQTKEAMKHFFKQKYWQRCKSIYSKQPTNQPISLSYLLFSFFVFPFPFPFSLPYFVTLPFYFYFLYFLHIFIPFVSDPQKLSSSVKLCLLLSFSPWSISLLEKKLVPLKANVFITLRQIVSNIDFIYFIIIRRYVCATYVSKWLIFSSDTDSLYLLHFALIIFDLRQSYLSNVPIQDLTHDAVMFRRFYHKCTVSCLVFTISLGRYFWESLNLCSLSSIFLLKGQPLQLQKASRPYLMTFLSKRWESFIQTKSLTVNPNLFLM